MILDRGIPKLTVIMPSWVGDIVMATPALRLLRNHLPNTHITAALRPGLGSLLKGLPDVDDCLEISPGGLLGPLKSGRRIAATDPEAVILLPNSMRSALVARFSHARQRIGFKRQGRSMLLTHAIEPETGNEIHTTLQDYVRLIERLVDTSAQTDSLQPRLALTDEDRKAAGEAMDLEDGRYAVLVPGANRLDKRWPGECFAELADRLIHEHGLRVAVTGSPAEQPVVKDVVEQADSPLIDLSITNMGLGGLKAILAGAALAVTNDTGPRHIAAALGTPVVSLFGPTDHRWTILPGIVERRILSEPFLPEEHLADRHPQRCRIDRITPDDVFAAAAALLADHPDSSL